MTTRLKEVPRVPPSLSQACSPSPPPTFTHTLSVVLAVELSTLLQSADHFFQIYKCLAAINLIVSYKVKPFLKQIFFAWIVLFSLFSIL